MSNRLGWYAGCNAPHEPAVEDEWMPTIRKQVVAIYVDRSSGGWIVRDSEGLLWNLPPTDHPWDDRQPFVPTEESELEPVPGHYRYLLGLPR